MRGHMPRSSSSCAACKLLKRRCTPTCNFAPYFRSKDPKTFAKVHKVFGASNVGKLLSEVPEEQRQETVNSLAFEADVRLKDPVYGCIGAIAALQSKMIQLQHDLAVARSRLARCGANCYASTSVNSSTVSAAGFCDLSQSYGELLLLDGFGQDGHSYGLGVGELPFV